MREKTRGEAARNMGEGREERRPTLRPEGSRNNNMGDTLTVEHYVVKFRRRSIRTSTSLFGINDSYLLRSARDSHPGLPPPQ